MINSNSNVYRLDIKYDIFRVTNRFDDDTIYFMDKNSDKTFMILCPISNLQIIFFRILNNIPSIICVNNKETIILSYVNSEWNSKLYPKYLYSNKHNIYFYQKKILNDVLENYCITYYKKKKNNLYKLLSWNGSELIEVNKIELINNNDIQIYLNKHKNVKCSLGLKYEFKNIKMCYIPNDTINEIYLYHKEDDIEISKWIQFIGLIQKKEDHPIIIDITNDKIKKDNLWTKLKIDTGEICKNCIPIII